MTDDIDSNLIDSIRNVTNRVYEEQLSDRLVATESLRLVGNTDVDPGMFQYEERSVTWALNSPTPNINILEVEKYKETEILSDYLEEEYDLRIVQPVLQTILTRIFGQELEYIDQYNQRLDDLAPEITADAKHPRYDAKTFIFAPDLQGENIELPKGVIDNPEEEDISYHVHHMSELIPGSPGINIDKEMLNGCILEFETSEKENLESQEEAHSVSNFTVNLLNLYFDASYSITRRELEPRYFRSSGSITTYPESRIVPENRFKFEETDEERIDHLYNLMTEYWSRNDEDTGAFDYPFDVVIEYLYRAWEQKNRTRESMGWLVIAFESLFGSGRGKVSTYCGVLLDSVDDVFDPIEVSSNMSNAFGERHSWAHGGSIKQSGMDDSQARVRDYLRASLIAYCYLITNSDLDNHKDVNDLLADAIIDEDSKSELKNYFSEFNFEDYLRISESLHSTEE